MKELKNLKNKNVYFTAFKITKHTDIMFKKMKESFGRNFTHTDEKVPKEFFKTMFDTLSVSIEDSRM